MGMKVILKTTTVPATVVELAGEARRQAQAWEANAKMQTKKTAATAATVRADALKGFAGLLDSIVYEPEIGAGETVAVPADRHAAMKALVAACERLRPARGFLTPEIPDGEVVNLNLPAGALREFVNALDNV